MSKADQLKSYFELTKVLAQMSTHFSEERLKKEQQPATLDIDSLFDEDIDDVIRALKLEHREMIQHAKLDSLLRGTAFTMPSALPGVNPALARRYEELLHEALEPKVKRFSESIHPEVRRILPDILRSADLKEHGANVYLYAVGQDRIIKPEYDIADPSKLIGYSVILPFDHMLQMLADSRAEEYARGLLPQFKEFCEDNRWLKGKVRRFFGKDTDRHKITDEQVLLHNVVKYSFEKVPGLAPILESMVNLRMGYGKKDALKPSLDAIKRLQGSYKVDDHTVDNDEIRHALRETGLLKLDTLSLAEAKRAASGADRKEIEWTERMLMDFDKIAKLNKKLFIDPLNGENVMHDEDAEENVRVSGRLVDRKHAWNRRSPSGRYLGLEHELNKEAGIWYRITHDLYILTSALVEEVGHDSSGVVRKFLGYQTLLDAKARSRIQGFVEDLNFSGTKVSELYDQLYQATKKQNGSVILPNPWGALLQDHKLHINLLLAQRLVRYAGDGNARGNLVAAKEKITAAIRENKEFELIIDLLTYDPSNAHKRKYGKIETAPVEQVSDALLAATRTYLGVVPDDERGDRFFQDMRVRIGSGLHEHPNNLKMIYAAGAYLATALSRRTRKDNDQAMIKSAENHLLDVKGWIESARDKQYADADEGEMVYIHHQLLSAAEYQLAKLYADVKEDNEYGSKKLIIDAYRHYNEFAGYVMTKMARGDNVIPIYKRMQIDTGAVNSDDPERLVKHLLLAPMNFHARRQAVKVLYEKGYAGQATELVRRSYHDAALLVSEKGLLTADDMVEVSRISDIAAGYAKQGGQAMPADLGALFSNGARRKEFYDKLLAYQGHSWST